MHVQQGVKQSPWCLYVFMCDRKFFYLILEILEDYDNVELPLLTESSELSRLQQNKATLIDFDFTPLL